MSRAIFISHGTVFTIVFHPEMYRDPVCHDCCLPLFCGCTRVSLCLLSVLLIRTTQSDPFIHDVFLSRFIVGKCPMRSESIGRHPVPRVAQRASAKCASLVMSTGGNLASLVVERQGGNPAICFQRNCSLWSFSRREGELSVILFCFFPSLSHVSFPGL